MKGFFIVCIFATSATAGVIPSLPSSLFSSIPSLSGALPTVPTGLPNVPLPVMPTGLPSLSALQTALPSLPSLPAGVPTLPALPTGISNLLPTVLPTLPSLPTGQLSYMQIFNLVTAFYNNPVNKLIPLPPITEMISVALKINSAVNSVSEANSAIQSMMRETAENILYSLGPTTTKAPSIFSGIFGRELLNTPISFNIKPTGVAIRPTITFPPQTVPTPTHGDTIG